MPHIHEVHTYLDCEELILLPLSFQDHRLQLDFTLTSDEQRIASLSISSEILGDKSQLFKLK